MINQKLTELSAATSASNSDVMYIVKNYTPGSPTLTGTSHQIAFSALTSGFTTSVKKDWIFAQQSTGSFNTTESTASFVGLITSGITMDGSQTIFNLNPSKSYFVIWRANYGGFANSTDGAYMALKNSGLTQTFADNYTYPVIMSVPVIAPGTMICVVQNTSTLVCRQAALTSTVTAGARATITIQEI